MTVALDALVFAAFDDLAGIGSEVDPWRTRYPLTETVAIPGVPTPLHHDGTFGVIATGIGKAAAATSVTACLSTTALDLTNTRFLSVGVAGGPPSVGPIGSVVFADAIVDWDLKLRDDGGTLEPNPYIDEQAVVHLDPNLRDVALDAAADVSLRSLDEVPTVTVGTNLCGDELWHGAHLATAAERLVAAHDVGPYAVTEMEDSATAHALRRFDRLDDYLCVRAVANYDRPVDGADFAGAFARGFPIAIDNAVTVASAVIDRLSDDGDGHR